MIFLPFFLALAFSEYIELDEKTAKKYIGGPIPIFVKFYSPQCGHCQAMAEDFSEASTMFHKNAIFGGVDCLANSQICEDFKVDGYPTIKLFLANSKDGIDYDGERTAKDFAAFVTDQTGAAAKFAPSSLLTLNPYNFANKTNKTLCTFVMFYAQWDDSSKHFIPSMKEAAQIFEPDPNVSIGYINCGSYSEFCSHNYSVEEYPSLFLFKNNYKYPFKGPQILGNVVKMINKQCGTERNIDGLLHDNVGVIPEASEYINDFLEAVDNKDESKVAEIIEKVKAIPSSETYVKVMQRVVQKGKEQLRKDLATMRIFMDERKGSFKVIDGMKKRFNVFRLFVPLPTPAPTPETQESAENAAEL